MVPSNRIVPIFMIQRSIFIINNIIIIINFHITEHSLTNTIVDLVELKIIFQCDIKTNKKQLLNSVHIQIKLDLKSMLWMPKIFRRRIGNMYTSHKNNCRAKWSRA